MSTTEIPTTAQIEALRMAAIVPLRYYKGGWYGVPAALGDQLAPAVGGASTNPTTISACVERGWLERATQDRIYDRRWPITSAGRAELERVK